ncbi:MAG: hypothetical protein IPK12_23480 [Gemmatimonadetes bacterium]|nr:hypothetical protein [Gemmatimonadota bacterium]
MKRLGSALPFLIACLLALASPALAQTPSIVTATASDTGGAVGVAWPRPAADSIEVKLAGCTRTKTNAQAWSSWDCAWRTLPRLAVQKPAPPTTPPPSPTPTPTPTPVPPTAGIDTAGMKLLAAVAPTRQNDPGTGPVKLANGGTWSGQMVYDATQRAIRYDLRDGCWGGTSAGAAWFEIGMTALNARTVYTRQWVMVSPNWVGHAVGMKMTILGWGTGPAGGNQQILFLRGSPGSATRALRVGWSWQGAGALPTAAKAGGLSGLDPKGGNFSVPGGVLTRGRWTKVETESYTGLPGTRTSWSKIWMDGQLVADVDGYDATTTLPTYALASYKLLSVWGGGASCTAPGGQQYWIRDVLVLGR